MWKKILSAMALLLLAGTGAGVWLFSLFDSEADKTLLQQTTVAQVPYLQQLPATTRGKVLAVVSSTALYPAAVVEGKVKKTGYELTELSRFYWVLRANGFAVDIASPQGGDAPRVLDGDDMGQYDYAFLHDAEAMGKARATLRLADVDPTQYQAVYFVGGKGAMYDFADNPAIARLVQAMLDADKLLLAVCHGPAALIQPQFASGQSWLAGKKLTSFTNAEELLLMPEAEQRFGFLLQSKLQQQGAQFSAGPRYLPNLVLDGRLITGQNPWSVWALAEAAVTALGVTPVPRTVSAEELTMQLLQTLVQQGEEAATAQIPQLLQQGALQRDLLLMMALVSALAEDWSESWQRVQLAAAVKHAQSQQTTEPIAGSGQSAD